MYGRSTFQLPLCSGLSSILGKKTLKALPCCQTRLHTQNGHRLPALFVSKAWYYTAILFIYADVKLRLSQTRRHFLRTLQAENSMFEYWRLVKGV